jgi:hypothetical protein
MIGSSAYISANLLRLMADHHSSGSRHEAIDLIRELP